MKKLLAVLLTLMLVLPNTVFADTATLYTLSDPTLTTSYDGEEYPMELTGLKIAAAVLGEDTCAINVIGNDEVLLSAAFKIEGDKVLFTADGLSNTYYVDKPDVEGSTSDLENLDLDISGIDFNALAENLVNSIEFGTEGDAMTFFLPHTALNDALDSLTPLLDQIPEAALSAEDKEQFLSTVKELKDKDNGFDISGTLTSTDEAMAFTADLIPVNEGQADEKPALSATGSFTSDENGAMSIQFSLSTPDGEVLSANVQIGDIITVAASVLGQYEVTFSFNPEESIVEIGYNADGTGYLLSAKVGVEENGEISVCPIGDAASAINAQELTEEQTQQLSEEFGNAASGLLNFFLGDMSDAEYDDAEYEDVEVEAEDAATDDAA